MADMKAYIAKAAAGERLSREEAERAFDIIMSGNATPAQIGAFLMALRLRGETVDEVTGAVRAMRWRSSTNRRWRSVTDGSDDNGRTAPP